MEYNIYSLTFNKVIVYANYCIDCLLITDNKPHTSEFGKMPNVCLLSNNK